MEAVMVYNRLQAAARAEKSAAYSPGMCLQWTRIQFMIDARFPDAAAAAAGAKKMHKGDRNPPRGVPVFWTGGSAGHGHIAVSLGDGKIRSTDAGGKGKNATVDLSWPEAHWGLHYVGWSEDLNGVLIPLPPVTRVDKAKVYLQQALSIAKRKGKKGRAAAISDALDNLPER